MGPGTSGLGVLVEGATAGRQFKSEAATCSAGLWYYPMGQSITFIPMAWRIFQDDILNMGRKTRVELYYVDSKGAVCAVLFHGYSVENLYRLIEPLFYDDRTLADVQVMATATKKATYYIAEFCYQPADPVEVQARQEFACEFSIWRAETYTGLADVKLATGYSLPESE